MRDLIACCGTPRLRPLSSPPLSPPPPHTLQAADALKEVRRLSQMMAALEAAGQGDASALMGGDAADVADAPSGEQPRPTPGAEGGRGGGTVQAVH